MTEQDDRVYSKKVLLCNKIDILIEQLEEFGPHTDPKNKQAAHHEMCVANLKAARRCITNDLFENYLTELNLSK